MRLQEYNVSRKKNTDTTSAILETHLLRCLAVCQSLGSPADSRYGSRPQRSSPAVNQSLPAQCNKSSKLNDKICRWPMPSRTTHRNSSRNLSKSFAKVKVCEKLPLCPTVNSTATNLASVKKKSLLFFFNEMFYCFNTLIVNIFVKIAYVISQEKERCPYVTLSITLGN